MSSSSVQCHDVKPGVFLKFICEDEIEHHMNGGSVEYASVHTHYIRLARNCYYLMLPGRQATNASSLRSTQSSSKSSSSTSLSGNSHRFSRSLSIGDVRACLSFLSSSRGTNSSDIFPRSNSHAISSSSVNSYNQGNVTFSPNNNTSHGSNID